MADNLAEGTDAVAEAGVAATAEGGGDATAEEAADAAINAVAEVEPNAATEAADNAVATAERMADVTSSRMAGCEVEGDHGRQQLGLVRNHVLVEPQQLPEVVGLIGPQALPNSCMRWPSSGYAWKQKED